jgi:hypothetical protein
VGLAFLRSTERQFSVERRSTIGVPVEDGVIWFAKTPAVAVSPQGVKSRFGIATAEIVYYLVRGASDPITGAVSHEATLVHTGLAVDVA